MKRHLLPAVGLLALFGLVMTAIAADDGSPARKSSRDRVPEVYKDYKAIEVKGGGSVEGVVLYKGDVPQPDKIAIVKDQEICKLHAPERPRISVNEKKQVENVVVFLNIKEGKASKAAESKIKVDQKSCDFSPHVQVVEVGQPVEIVNSDATLHNIQATQKMRTLFNHVQSNKGMLQKEKFSEVGLVSLNCQAHNWMQGWIYVLPHPYHAVTGADGGFKLTDVPPGEYELHVWQEHVGEQVTDIKVEAGKPTKVDYEMKPKSSRRR